MLPTTAKNTSNALCPMGSFRNSTRKRPGTVGICSAIMHRFGVDAVPHVLCGGFSREETEDFLIDLHYLGIDNALVLRGDPAKPFTTFKAKENGYTYASELVEQVANMNRGIYLHEEDTALAPSSFCIGVAAYPKNTSKRLTTKRISCT